jgi:IclR family acetate operon transcriptional repressor
VTVSALENEFATVRARGYAVDNEENEIGTVCVAAAFSGHDGRPVGALSTSGPSWRVGEEIVEAMGTALIAACKSLGELL